MSHPSAVRRRLRFAAACAAALLAVPALRAADPTVSPTSMLQREKLAALEFLVGEWRGAGWILMPDGTRAEFRQSESIGFALQGEILLIRGIGTADAGEGEPMTVHDAIGIVTYDPQKAEYRWLARRAGGEWIDSRAEVGAHTLEWSMTTPNGVQVRYRITVDGSGRWREVGEASRDGATWRQVFAMELERST